jgi:hypothetical protein
MNSMSADPAAPPTNYAPAPESSGPTADTPGLKEYLQEGPKVDEFEIEPDGDTGREIAL